MDGQLHGKGWGYRDSQDDNNVNRDSRSQAKKQGEVRKEKNREVAT